MEKIDLGKIRGRWQETKEQEVGLVDGNGIEYGKGKTFSHSAGDDTIESIKLVAEKVNEIVEWINAMKKMKYVVVTTSEKTISQEAQK